MSPMHARCTLLLSWFSTKLDAVFFTSRRNDIPNELSCRGHTSVCFMCEITNIVRFSTFKRQKSALGTRLAPYFSAGSQPNRMQFFTLVEEMIYPTSCRTAGVLQGVVCSK